MRSAIGLLQGWGLRGPVHNCGRDKFLVVKLVEDEEENNNGGGEKSHAYK